jgi:hypothetical protein
MISRKQGQVSLQVIVLSAVVVVLITGFTFLAVSFLQLSTRSLNRNLSFSIAEAGIEYYRWHLAHAPEDFQDGTGAPGPYVHQYYARDGRHLGSFELEIEPVTGTSMVRIRSTGSVLGDSTTEKTIEVLLGKPSLARYAVAANSAMRFGEGTEIFGEVFSNGGIRFDGYAHNTVQSAQETYDDPDHSGGVEYGVHTHLGSTDPLPPGALPDRADVFGGGRQFPLPAIDFAGITQDLSQLRTDAQASGIYLANSGSSGYELVFNANGTYDLYRVTSLRSAPSGCSNSASQAGWGTWSVNNRTQVTNDGTLPANGIFFVEDHLWVSGTVSNRHVTVASGRFPVNSSTYTSITVNADLTYGAYDGSAAVALIAQNNVNVGLFSENDLRIDAALVAQNGRVGRYYYQGPGGGSNRCSPNHVRTTLTSYGTLVTNGRYGFAYTDGTGYQTRNLTYDANLLYGPPPGFPLASDQYELLSWEEVR